MRLFVYGSLMEAARVRDLLDRDVPYRLATVSGYRRLQIARLPYPFAVEDAGSTISGHLLEPLTDVDLKTLDAYERTCTGLFHRVEVQVRVEGTETSAWIYLGGASLRRRAIQAS